MCSQWFIGTSQWDNLSEILENYNGSSKGLRNLHFLSIHKINQFLQILPTHNQDFHKNKGNQELTSK